MKVLLINGSPKPNGNTAISLREMETVFREEGIEVETVQVGSEAIRGCTACGFCHRNGKCVFDDIVNETVPKFEECDGIVVASPVYYASANSTLTAFLDRLFYISKGRMAGKIGASVVSCRRGGATAAFDRLNKYFGISNMHIAGSQYWNQIHGNTPEEANQDLEGLQTMRTLAQNMVWLMKCKEAGIEMPEYEKKVATNFIR